MEITEISAQNFDAEVLEEADRDVLLLAHDKNCPLCQQTVPVFEGTLADRVDPQKAKLTMLELGQPRPPDLIDVPSVPYLYIYRNGQQIAAMELSTDNRGPRKAIAEEVRKYSE
ncbi:MAG: thioredoxin domain-containing protein [Desulfohalobiaceae bacterium]